MLVIVVPIDCGVVFGGKFDGGYGACCHDEVLRFGERNERQTWRSGIGEEQEVGDKGGGTGEGEVAGGILGEDRGDKEAFDAVVVAGAVERLDDREVGIKERAAGCGDEAVESTDGC